MTEEAQTAFRQHIAEVDIQDTEPNALAHTLSHDIKGPVGELSHVLLPTEAFTSFLPKSRCAVLLRLS